MQLLTQLKPSPFARNHLIRDAIGKAIADRMAADPAVHLFGEGAAVKVHYDAPDIEARFGDRVHTLPISEDGNVNFAVGASLLGGKPVVDIISADFLYRAMDSICNTAAKLNYVTGREHTIVIRAEFLVGGPTTGQRPEALFAHIPGLRVVIPSTPNDAYGLMQAALTTPGVTLFFEDRMIADNGFFADGDFYTGDHVPFGRIKWRIRNPMATLTVLSYGVMRQRVEALVSEHRGNVNFYDLRSIYPLDIEGILDAVRRTGRLLIVEPDVTHGGVGAEIVAQVTEYAPSVRVKRLGAPRMTTPASIPLHARVLPSDQEVLDAIASLT